MPRYELSADAIQTALQSAPDPHGRPLQFAVGVPTDLRLTEGRWDDLDADTARWRLRLRSPGALSLNLQLADVRLPPSAQLWLYDISGRIAQGPYTEKQLSKDGRLWTAMVPGEEAVLELRVAKPEMDKAGLQIAQINHGFADIANSNVPSKAGACNINVACPEGDGWRDEIRSVAQITINGQFICTGQLVNNAKQDLRPLFLTANHCGIGKQGLPADSVVFYWNFQSTQCGSDMGSNLEQNQSGSTLLANDAESDFSLLLLAQNPLPEFKVYFSGWNNAPDSPQSGVSIHHPDGDRMRADSHKRISLYNTRATATDVSVSGQLTHAWQIQWAKGVTEEGSSGSGLWDQNHYLVGVLSGGGSDCDHPNDPDYYARFNAGWTANPQPSGQLKANLDPDNSDRVTLAGRDPQKPASKSDDSGTGLLLGGTFEWTGLTVLLGFAGLRRKTQDPVFSIHQ